MIAAVLSIPGLAVRGLVGWKPATRRLMVGSYLALCSNAHASRCMPALRSAHPRD